MRVCLTCEGWHFTDMWKHLHDRIISLSAKIWVHKTSSAKTEKWSVMHLCVLCIEFASFFDFCIGFWKCSNIHGIFLFLIWENQASSYSTLMKVEYIIKSQYCVLFLWPFWRYLICSEYFIPNCLRIRSCIVLNVAGMSNVVIHRICGIYYLFYICKVWCLLIDIKKNKKIPHCRYSWKIQSK